MKHSFMPLAWECGEYGQFVCICICVCIITVRVLYVWCSIDDDTVVSELQWNSASVISLTQAFKIDWIIIKDTFDSIHCTWVESGMGYSSLSLFLHNYPRQSTFTYKIRELSYSESQSFIQSGPIPFCTSFSNFWLLK